MGKYVKTYEDFILDCLSTLHAYQNVQEDNHAAFWDNPRKKKIDALKVSCTEDYEPRVIFHAAKNHFGDSADDDTILQAIKTTCERRKQSRERKDFEQAVYNEIRRLIGQ